MNHACKAWDSFDDAVTEAANASLRRGTTTTLQVNVGKRCNQTCRHCHVGAGPNRTESMSKRVALRLLALLDANPSFDTVDITGGAPEIWPHFRWFVEQLVARRLTVIDRCNLTVLLLPEQVGTAEFLAQCGVNVVASLPCFEETNVDKQRGQGVFTQSIQALQLLNSVGYGRADTGLTLDLVYNPVGAFLPPDQATLEALYRERLFADHGVVFSALFTITNLPVDRFNLSLKRSGEAAAYSSLLRRNFNPETLPGLMCRSLLSVDYNGELFDCDFNQMLGRPLGGSTRPRTVFDLTDVSTLTGDKIGVGEHCFGCTAGAGSSCGGALATEASDRQLSP